MKTILIIISTIVFLTVGLDGQTGLPQPSENNEVIIDAGKVLTKPMKRFNHFMEMRTFPFNEVTQEKRINAIKSMESIFHNGNKKAITQAQQPEWRPIGPFNVGGRVKSVAIHPSIAGTVYIGAAAGGIWKTTNAGTNWTPIFDYENGIGFGSLSIDVNNPDIIYAATGEAVLNSAAPIYLSAGVYKSTDAGNSWLSIGLTNVGAFSKIYVHPLNSNKVVGGVVGFNGGFYYSTDAGESWNKSENFDKSVTDVSINPNNENEYFVGVLGEGIFYSSDSGLTWEKRSAGLPALHRVSVQMAPSAPDILYTLFEEGGSGGTASIYKSTNRGASWQRSYKGSEEFFNGQGWYDNYIMVHPSNPNIVFAGGIDLWRTTSGGGSSVSWGNTTDGYSGGSVHVDHHCGAFNPLNPNEIYIGNDGGVYKSTNLGDDYTELNNGMDITQFYSLDIDKNVENRTFGGTQDNGTLGNHASATQWGYVNGGDGFRTVIDFDNTNQIFGEVYSSNSVYPFRRNVVNSDYRLLVNGLTDDVSGIWDPPLEIHPQHNFALYHGRTALYFSFSSGNYWEVGIPKQEYKFSAIGISPISDELIYAGNIAGKLFVTKNHFAEYKNVSSNGLVVRAITDIECSRLNAETAVVSFSGYGTDHVYKTTNAGETWASISHKLPDVPCNTLAMHPENEDIIFVGTDIGVFATFNGGQSWLPYGRKLPRTIVTDMKIQNSSFTGSYILRVATFGRSMWEIDIPADVITEAEITSPTGGEILTGRANYTLSWYGFDLPVKAEVTWDNGVNWFTFAEELNSDNFSMKMPNKESHLNRIRISSISNPEQVKISNTFSITPVKKGSILATSSYHFVPYGIAWDGDQHLYASSFYENKIYKINKNTLIVDGFFTVPGDSLFTDLTIDRANNKIYLHKMNSSGSTGTGGIVIITDMDGNEIKRYVTPAKEYPIGLELVDNDLLICDRDGSLKYMYITEPGTGKIWSKVENPFKENLGPRSICYDGSQYLYQASTDFTGESFIAGYIVKIDKSDLSQEVDRMKLMNKNNYINCRGIEFDRDDKHFWVTDFGGNIYKIAGFETISEIEEEIYLNGEVAACENTTESYSVTSADKYLKKWETVGGNIIGVDTASTVDVQWGQAGNGIIKVTLQTATIIKDTLEKNIIIGEIPNVSYESEIKEICQNDTLLLTGGLPSGGKYSGTDVENGFLIPQASGEFEITYTYSENGCSDSAKVQIAVKPFPTVTYNTDVKELCINDEILLSGGLPQGGIYTGEDVNNGLFNPQSQGDFEIKYTYFDGVCSNSDIDTIIVYPLPEKPTITRNNKVLVSSSGLTYQWFKDSVAIPSATEKEYSPVEAGNFQVLITDEHDCENVSDVYFFDPTDVENNTTNNLLIISPNPMSDFSTISFGTWGVSQDIEISIYDVMGRKIYHYHKIIDGNRQSSQIQIDSKDFESGMYYILFQSDGKTILNKKLVVIR
ncbi:MAG: T9SS type A sorting domain-containing protein [bacterium]